MASLLNILIFCFLLLSTRAIGQEKVDEELFIFSNWAIEYYSDGEPFISSDTIILFHCGPAYTSRKIKCYELGIFEWELMFDNDEDLKKNWLLVHSPDSTTLSLGELPDEIEKVTYMYEHFLFWKLKGRKMCISYGKQTVNYTIGKLVDEHLIFVKQP